MALRLFAGSGPVQPVPTAMSTTTLPAPAPLPDPPAPIASLEPLSLVESPQVETAAARLVVRMLGGEELELATFDDRSAAIDAAKELVRGFCAAEESGDWPELDGRFLRPGSVASIDVSRVEDGLSGLEATTQIGPSPHSTGGLPRRDPSARLEQHDLLPVELRHGRHEPGETERQVPGTNLVVDRARRLRPVDSHVVVVLEVAGPGRAFRPVAGRRDRRRRPASSATAATRARRGESLGPNSAMSTVVVPIGIVPCARRWPVSSSASIRCHVEPHSVSPSRRVQANGIGPRWRGRSPGCWLIEPRRGTSSAALRDLPRESPSRPSGRARKRGGVARSTTCPWRREGRPRRRARAREPEELLLLHVATGREQRDRLVPEVAQGLHQGSAIGRIEEITTMRQDSATPRA